MANVNKDIGTTSWNLFPKRVTVRRESTPSEGMVKRYKAQGKIMEEFRFLFFSFFFVALFLSETLYWRVAEFY